MWEIYDALLDGLPDDLRVAVTAQGTVWTCAETNAGGIGLAMTTVGETRPARHLKGLEGLPLRQAAAAVTSWNYEEASVGMAAINAWYNSPARLASLHCEEPQKGAIAADISVRGKDVGVVGHLSLPEGMLAGAANVYVLERVPRPGDYPDPACEYLLPRCALVIISGSALINKTLPRLINLSRNADVVLIGPTVPMAPALLKLGVRRLSGLVLDDAAGIRAHVDNHASGNPYRFGRTFLLEKRP